MHWIVWSSVGVLGSRKGEFRKSQTIVCEVTDKSPIVQVVKLRYPDLVCYKVMGLVLSRKWWIYTKINHADSE